MADRKELGALAPSLSLHIATPRETAGREAISRFQAQFRGASLACLQILQGGAVDRVYCDYHDDFVVRERDEEKHTYRFFQVKTKGEKKHQWSRLELFGITKKKPASDSRFYAPGGAPVLADEDQIKRMRSSFVGKLLEHTAMFGDSCASVTFMTNAFLEDDVEAILAALIHGNFNEKTIRYLSDNYDAVFEIAPPQEMSAVHASIRKLSMSSGVDYLDPHHSEFSAKTLAALYNYSEINLTHTEGMELSRKLLDLVEKKSSQKIITGMSVSDLEVATGVGLDDLLDMLPISRAAYLNFVSDGDVKALKSATILQRKLAQAGATSAMIEAASRWKIEWDNWYRTNRHTYEHAITFIQQDLNAVYGKWQRGEVSFASLQGEVVALRTKHSQGPVGYLLTEELLTGGVMAELVRSESQ